jgi:hypothetical protein
MRFSTASNYRISAISVNSVKLQAITAIVFFLLEPGGGILKPASIIYSG